MTLLQDGGRPAPAPVWVAASTLSIRALAEQDHQAIHEILSSRSVIEGTMRLPHEAAHKTVERLAPRSATVHLVADIDGRPVGILELVTWPDEPRHRHVDEVNLVAIHPDWTGRGAGRALMETAIELADDWLNLRRLSLVVFVDNPVALELYRRLGFVVEGTMVEYGFKRGRYIDAHVMARLNGSTPYDGLD
jgi:L-phenylalanine/L-methionine N-acetyltransferase